MLRTRFLLKGMKLDPSCTVNEQYQVKDFVKTATL